MNCFFIYMNQVYSIILKNKPNNMEIFYQIKLFLFIFSILYLIKYGINVLRVMRAEEGRIDNTTTDLVLLGSALSYVITLIITGF